MLFSSTIFYKGYNFEAKTDKDISDKIDMTTCANTILTGLALPQTTRLDYQYFNFFNSIAPKINIPSSEWLVTTKTPLIIIGVSNKGEIVDAPKYCPPEAFSTSFQVQSDIDNSALSSLSNRGVDPFDSGDTYFTDVCSLGLSSKDTTLNSRKNLHYYDPKEYCSPLEGQVCSVTDFDDKGNLVCSCKSSSGSLIEFAKGFLYAFSESNVRLVKCYGKVFRFDTVFNPGFIVGIILILFFYSLQAKSSSKTLGELGGEYFYQYIYNSATFCLCSHELFFAYMKKIKEDYIFKLENQRTYIYRKSKGLLNEDEIKDLKPEMQNNYRRASKYNKTKELDNSNEQNSNDQLILEQYSKGKDRLRVKQDYTTEPIREVDEREESDSHNGSVIEHKNQEEVPFPLVHMESGMIREFCKVVPSRQDYDSLPLDKLHWDKRSILALFIRFCADFHIYYNVFLHKTLITPLHFRQFTLLTIIMSQMAFNAFFFTEEVIDSRTQAENTVKP